MKTIIVYVFSLFLILGRSCSSKEKKIIEEKIKKAMTENNVPSLSIGVICNGKIKLLKGFGVKSRNNRTEVDENSIFQIASQSKMFTGIIVNNLIQEGKLNLNEPITSYFSSDINHETKNRLGKITLKILLNHKSGIPSDACSLYSERIDGDAWTKGYSKENLIKDINNINLEFEPNSQFRYSNSGYAIVGYICERVSSLNYSQLLKKYVTKKYNLENTVVSLNEIQKSILVTPYRKDDRNIETTPSNMGMATPASAIYSNAKDLTKIMLKQIATYRLSENKNDQNPLIVTQYTATMNEKLNYGFGLIKEKNGLNIKYGHGGDADGFACEYFFNPKKNTGVIILTSSGGRWIGELADGILEDLCE